jgi:biotin carboxylase
VRVLIVGTNRACHLKLFSQGHEAVLLMPRSKATPADLAAPYQHVAFIDDGAAVTQWVELAVAFHRAATFDAVVAYNESTYHVANAVSALLGVPCIIDVELFQRVLDKSLTRRILDEHGIPSCKYVCAAGREAVISAIRHIGMPCIVKPVDGEASRGISKVGDAGGIEIALERLGSEQIERGVMVEEFLVGDEYSVEAISTGSDHHVVAVTKKFKDEQTFVERGHVVPAPIAPEVREAVEKYVMQVLSALEFHDCPSHTELMLTADGPRLIETHNRIGGDRIMDLVHHATGIDMYDLVARQSVGEDVSYALPQSVGKVQYAAIWYADPSLPASHRLVEVRGFDRVRALPYMKTLELLKQPGSRGAIVSHSFDRSCLAIAVGDTDQQAVDRAKGAIHALEFLYAWAPADAAAV